MTKRIAFFAHYDRDGIIDDYVIFYLRALMRVSDRILFVSDCELKAGEMEKLDGIAEFVFAGRHGEYDFGSWKRCFEALNYDLSAWDEVIVANDSCFLVQPIDEFFAKMDRMPCDWWGPTWGRDARAGIKSDKTHINSYFVVFKRPVLESQDFLNFWRSVKKQENKIDIIIAYELGLSRLLRHLNFRSAALAKREMATVLHSTCKIPWVRMEIFKANEFRVGRLDWQLTKLSKHCDTGMIDKYIERLCGTARPKHYFYKMTTWKFEKFGLRVTSHLKRGKADKQAGRRVDWQKTYAYIFGIPIFAFAARIKR
jgi:hypothetical protein